jgi:hypothetical protein
MSAAHAVVDFPQRKLFHFRRKQLYLEYKATKTIMKQLFAIAAMLVLATSVSAQDVTTVPPANAGFSKSIAAKWNPLSLAFGKIGLLGEYNFRNKKSFTFGIGIPAEYTNSYFKINDKKRDIKMKTFSLMAGYRMYLGKKNMRGLYFEPYAKYVKSDASSILDGEVDGNTVEFMTTSNYSGVGVGAQLGVQFLIANRVTFDFFFLGPEANISKHDLLMKQITAGLPWTAQGAQDAENEIRDAVDNIPILKDNIEVNVDAATKTVSSKYSGFLPGIRFGLSLGVRF